MGKTPAQAALDGRMEIGLAAVSITLTDVVVFVPIAMGIVNARESDKPLAIHGVQHVFHPPAPLPGWPDDDHRTRIVFITRDLEREVIAEMLDGVLGLADDKGI